MILTQLRTTFSRQVATDSVRNVKASLTLVYQNSNAESVLIHHQDIAPLREVRGTATGNFSCPIFHPASRQYKRVYPTTREAATNYCG